MADLFRWVAEKVRSFIEAPPKRRDAVYLVDREGVVYRPSRKVILRARERRV